METTNPLGSIVGRGLFVLGAVSFIVPLMIIATMLNLRDAGRILAGTYFAEAGLVGVALWTFAALVVMFAGNYLMVKTGFIERDEPSVDD